MGTGYHALRGLEKTYAWIHNQYLARQRGEAGIAHEAEVSR
jgi:hypothetical protein